MTISRRDLVDCQLSAATRGLELSAFDYANGWSGLSRNPTQSRATIYPVIPHYGPTYQRFRNAV